MYVRKSRQLGAILLISGTTIGAGMLALPVQTGIAGYFPSIALFVFYWIMSVITAFFMLEVNLWFKQPVNLLTMCKYTLGKKGQVFAWIIYLLLLYSLTAAYLAGSGLIIDDALNHFFDESVESWVSPLIFLMVFGTFTFLGTRPVDLLNRVLMISLVIIYAVLLALSYSSVKKDLLVAYSPNYVIAAIPVVVTAFGFHIVIPSLTNYLNKNVTVLKRVIWLGSFLPLVVYLLWETITVGSIPVQGAYGLKEAKDLGQSATYCLSHLLNHPGVTVFSSLFSFVAIVTSFLGVGLSLSHFLADGFKIHPNKKGRFFTAFLTYAPALFFVFAYPQGFIKALDYAGIFVALLLGILPCLMVLKGRKEHKGDVVYKVGGGKPLIFFVMIAYVIVIMSVII